MRRPRELLAVLVVLVGGTLWLVLPDMRGGSLRDDSATARWTLRPPGSALAAWVMVDNAGPRTITLTGASIGSPLPAGARVLGTRARIGKVMSFAEEFPTPPGAFRRLEGFRIPPNRGATIGFGLALPEPGVVALEDVRVTYREGGGDEVLHARRTARICVAVRRRAC